MRLSRILAISSLLVAASFSMASGLTIGSKAPALKVTDWVKGKPQKLGNGNVTVVEFWATWCGPCRESIPHLTELAHKYKGKVNFVGVSISESKPEDYKKKVPQFVKDFGAKMDYNVATEGPKNFMSTNWMDAAGENGIPTAFLVDKKGNIAWIGHPMGGLDEAIRDLLAGKLDVKKLKADREKARAGQGQADEEQKKMAAKVKPTVDALRAMKYELASKEADKLMSDEALKPLACQYKLLAMVQGKLPGLDTYLASLGNEDFAKDPDVMNSIIWTVVENDLGLAPEVYKACVTLGEKMMAATPEDPMNMDTYALSLWRSGDKAGALASQKKAVELAPKDKRVTEDTLKEMKDRLKMYGG